MHVIAQVVAFYPDVSVVYLIYWSVGYVVSSVGIAVWLDRARILHVR